MHFCSRDAMDIEVGCPYQPQSALTLALTLALNLTLTLI